MSVGDEAATPPLHVPETSATFSMRKLVPAIPISFTRLKVGILLPIFAPPV